MVKSPPVCRPLFVKRPLMVLGCAKAISAFFSFRVRIFRFLSSSNSRVPGSWWLSVFLCVRQFACQGKKPIWRIFSCSFFHQFLGFQELKLCSVKKFFGVIEQYPCSWLSVVPLGPINLKEPSRFFIVKSWLFNSSMNFLEEKARFLGKF